MASQSIQVLGPNQSELITTEGTVLRTIFFSYKMPVVIRFDWNYDKDNLAKLAEFSDIFVTSEKHSVTTSRHINKYLDGLPAEYVSQNEIYRLGDVMDREGVHPLPVAPRRRKS